MNAEDNQRANKTGANLRAILDFVMGTVYLVLAGFVLYNRHFGTIELSPVLVYGMAGMLVLYGGFRIYLGIGRYKNGR